MSKKKKQKQKFNTWQPLKADLIDPDTNPNVPSRFKEKEMWKNDIYTVFVNRGIKTPLGKITWLSIKRNDREAAKDWRHFQYIKNQLVGRENEGCEIYPAESRLVDGSNQYHLWVFEDTEMSFPFGFNEERMVTDCPVFEGAKQRPFEDNMKPHDLDECNQRIKEQVRALKLESAIEKNQTV